MIGQPAVIDTNVVVSGLLTAVAAAPTARIVDGMLGGEFRFLLSEELLAEYREVLLRPSIRRRHGLSDSEVDVVLTDIAANGTVRETRPTRGEDRKRENAHVRALLETEASAILVSGDRRLLEGTVGRAEVLTPRAFADLLDATGPGKQ